ncbi:CubicO group peptidase (beta-lactamase class C family) [Conyzicola lurida]|uniref:CubicO group peptidase (Beta-lactamase class C family) n=1 Tax=Conyzicola lurida TaxID=1172621 RepID=A0A841AKU0_9MICO|nr:CubicO group peptidase (beta-lactamase class C family) [Conyzicola lurida]
MTDLSPALESTLRGWFDAHPVVSPSVNYGVFDRDGVIFQHGVGEHRFDGRTPQLDTVYRIASMSKSFEMALVLVLRDRGLLSLDDRVSAHVPEFSDPVDDAGVELPVTIHMLMSNSSGLPEDNGWADHELALSREDFLAVVGRGLHFADLPGSGYQYSNIGFWLLGVIVENVSGLPFADFSRQTLLDPLGLDDTRYDAARYGDDHDLALGFGTFDEGATWFDRPFVGTGIGGCAASMFSTITDIARWSAWLSSAFDPSNTDDALLSRASRREMQRIHTFAPSPSDFPDVQRLEGSGYGLGLVVEQDVRFGSIVQHAGGLPGWSSNMRWHAASGLGVVVFANTNGVRPGIAAAGILRAVLEELDVPARPVALWPSTVDAAVAVEAAVDAGTLAAAAALFSPNLLSDVSAEVRDGRLAKAVAEVGGLTESRAPLADRLAWTTAGAYLAWTLPGMTGTLELRMEMTPTTPAMIQRLDIEVQKPVTGLSPVTRHYLPTL